MQFVSKILIFFFFPGKYCKNMKKPFRKCILNVNVKGSVWKLKKKNWLESEIRLLKISCQLNVHLVMSTGENRSCLFTIFWYFYVKSILYFLRKYERTKEIITGFKKNEDDLKNTVSDLANKVQKGEERFEILKSHAEEKLNE